MSRCKYCCYGKSNSSGNPNYATVAQLETAVRSNRREMAHLRTNDIALVELVEELQHRVKQLQDRVEELQRWCESSYVVHQGVHYVQSPVTLLKPEVYITHQLTPFEIYRRYLVGDYKEDKEMRGFQLDEDILAKRDVKPAAMLQYLDSPQAEDNHEVDRPRERIWVKEMFISIGSESGAAQAELSEYYDMLNGPDRELAIQSLQRLYAQGVMDTEDATTDTVEEDA